MSVDRKLMLRSVRMEMACVALAAARHVSEDAYPYACNSIKAVVERCVPPGAQWYMGCLMLVVFEWYFKPRRTEDCHGVWWPEGHREERVLALLLFQQMIERASIQEVESWVMRAGVQLKLLSAALVKAKAQAGKPMLRGGKGVGA